MGYGDLESTTIEDGKPGATLSWMSPPTDTCEVHGYVRSLSKPGVRYKMRTTLRRTRKDPSIFGIGRISEDVKGAEHEEDQFIVKYGWKSKEKESVPGHIPMYFDVSTHSDIEFVLGLERGSGRKDKNRDRG